MSNNPRRAAARPSARASAPQTIPLEDAPRVRAARPTMRRPEPAPKRNKIIGGAVAALAAALVAVGIFAYAQSLHIDITVNGQEERVATGSTLSDLVDAGIASPTPGNLLAIDGSIAEEGGGVRFTATVNGTEVDDENAVLAEGDTVQIDHGHDVTEDYTESTVDVAPQLVFEGSGAIHCYTGDGTPGKVNRKTGNVSGVVVDETIEEPTNAVVKKYNAQTGDDRVVALTFDDGPWPDTTDQILDILAENGAKATFFTIGSQIDGAKADSVKRAYNEGHQICTHTWDHAAGSGQGVNLGYMSAEEQVQEVQKGYDAISQVTGAEASRVIRTPGGNFNESTALNLKPLVSAEIGWNIDTEDWRRPGAEAIAEKIKQAKNGSIILMHDGGGDRSQTVEALRIALPYLKEQGFRFVTIDELLAYNDPANM